MANGARSRGASWRARGSASGGWWEVKGSPAGDGGGRGAGLRGDRKESGYLRRGSGLGGENFFARGNLPTPSGLAPGRLQVGRCALGQPGPALPADSPAQRGNLKSWRGLGPRLLGMRFVQTWSLLQNPKPRCRLPLARWRGTRRPVADSGPSDGSPRRPAGASDQPLGTTWPGGVLAPAAGGLRSRGHPAERRGNP